LCAKALGGQPPNDIDELRDSEHDIVFCYNQLETLTPFEVECNYKSEEVIYRGIASARAGEQILDPGQAAIASSAVCVTAGSVDSLTERVLFLSMSY